VPITDDLWPHQEQALAGIESAEAGGWNRVLLCTPTGGGKTRVIAAKTARWLAQGLRVAVYTNRRLLVDQLRRVLDGAGFGDVLGVRAAGHQDQRELPLQVCSIQTETARVFGRELGAWELHQADRYVVDEAHLMTGETVERVMNRHRDEGAFGLGVTATPIGLRLLYDHLIVAGTNAELRKCGALVVAEQYGVGEPDLRHVKKLKLGEDLTEKLNAKAIMTQSILGETIKHYRRLNPEGRPALGFAPGVAESLWFAEQFHANGISAASIDGASVWMDGKEYKTDQSVRQEVLDRSRAGDLKVVWNRFVLREGIDMPWVEHMIFATVFGSLASFLQSGGRGLRASPDTGKTHCVIQDHGGNWHRHGSLNADRDWDLSLTPAMAAGLRLDPWLHPKPGERPPPQPTVCPKCSRVLAVLRCPCGFEIDTTRRSRPVVQVDGSLVLVEGDVYTAQPTKFKPDTHVLWQKVYYRAKASGMTFRAAEGLFYHEHRYYPPRNLPLMPKHQRDWYRDVADVPYQQLIPRGE
jgi:DNA repair protein RadD